MHATDTARHNLTVLVKMLAERNTRVIGMGKARGIARAMSLVAGVRAQRIGGFWTLRMDVDGATLRLTVPADEAMAERDGAVVALDGTPAPEMTERAAKIEQLRAEIKRIEAAPAGVRKAAVATPAHRLPPGESELSWTVKIANLARQVPQPGSEAWNTWRSR